VKKRFFFYGTLTHAHDNPVTRAVLPLLGPARRLGTRPAARGAPRRRLVSGADARSVSGRVFGYVYDSGPRFTRATLRLLDSYENCDPRRPARSEYRRRTVTVHVPGQGTVRADAYLFNRPLHPGLCPIPGGDFAAFIAARGLSALGSGRAGARRR
jgi:gamma-glutamylcyclotransferase (GGCT)/AIG2-like uncharacterized protein YtfP